MTKATLMIVFLMCVERFTEWMWARTKQRRGLTGEKAAQLLVQESWGEVGVPAIITTDQDTRFVSAFFLRVCEMLGIRVAFSQAHRPQANGRAESAGRVVRDVIRRLFAEEKRSWLVLLPMAVRIRHDTIDPELGFSPYQLVFGRDRPGVGIPWAVVRENEEAEDWFSVRDKTEQEVGEKLRSRIREGLWRSNKGRPERNFKVGDMVWIKRARGVTGPGLRTMWVGPAKIVEQTETQSFVVAEVRGLVPHHADQLKLCVRVTDPIKLEVCGPVCKVITAKGKERVVEVVSAETETPLVPDQAFIPNLPATPCSSPTTSSIISTSTSSTSIAAAASTALGDA